MAIFTNNVKKFI